MPIPTDVPLKQNKDYKIVGQRLPRVDSPAKVKGEAVFGIDYRMPGMKFALLSRCPTIGGKVSAFDDKESKKISGVSYVGKIGDSAVAVVADSVWGAMEGRRVLNVTWDEGPNKDLNTAAVHGVAETGRIEKSREPILSRRRPRRPRDGASPPNMNCPSWRTRPWSREIAPHTTKPRRANCGRRRRFHRIAATRSRPRLVSIPIKSKSTSR